MNVFAKLKYPTFVIKGSNLLNNLMVWLEQVGTLTLLCLQIFPRVYFLTNVHLKKQYST